MLVSVGQACMNFDGKTVCTLGPASGGCIEGLPLTMTLTLELSGHPLFSFVPLCVMSFPCFDVVFIQSPAN